MKNLILLIIVLQAQLCFSQKTYVPDDGFEQALIFEGLDNVMDDSIETSIIDTLSNLNLDPFSIVDLTGIEDFVSLKTLVCRNNNIISIDLNSNTQLTFLNCENNNVSSINVTNCPLLTEINADNNNLTSLDLSQNPLLEALNITQNNISSLDFSPNPLLTELIAPNSGLNTLSFGSNSLVETIDVSTNNLNSLDVTNLVNLDILLLFSNNLTEIDLSVNTALTLFFGHDNLFNSLNFETNTALTYITCYNSPVSTIILPNIDTTSQQAVNFVAHQNPNLTCIFTEYPTYITNNWHSNIDANAFFSSDCFLHIPAFQPSFLIYPNPSTNGEITIKGNKHFSYVIYSLIGKVVAEGTATSEKISISTSNLSSGLYYVSINTGNYETSHKIVVN